MADKVNLPPALAEISKGRDFLKTAEFARVFAREPQTIRKLLCANGHALGIRPTKIGGRNLWPVTQVAALLNGEA